MDRPQHLPDFAEPPLDEVVLGVQFAPVANYSSIHSHPVWDIFREEFPNAAEQPLLEPKFETFGGSQQQRPMIQFGPSPIGSRFFFSSEDENHLLQFQSDRLITNWRKSPTQNPYPRFESIADAFDANLQSLSRHLKKDFSYEMDVNQAEIAYINIIPVESFQEAEQWLTVWNGNNLDIEGVIVNFGEIVKNENDKPFARLICEIQSILSPDGESKAIRLALTFRGKPEGNDIDAAMDFIKVGREKIVSRFSEITTESAHRLWKRLS